ncbi:unnamed protein product, partial [marine sediment metagenome]
LISFHNYYLTKDSICFSNRQQHQTLPEAVGSNLDRATEK